MMISTKPLKTCRQCGHIAFNDDKLSTFKKDRTKSLGYANICKQCHNANRRKGGSEYEGLFEKKQQWKKINYSPKLILFNGKQIRLPYNPRTNICSICGKTHPNELKHQTHLHHKKYGLKDPLEETIELCSSCHRKVHCGTLKI